MKSSTFRLLAAACHAAILIPGVGVLAPLAVWAVQRRKQAGLCFQAMQALGWQLLLTVFAPLLALVYLSIMAVLSLGIRHGEIPPYWRISALSGLGLVALFLGLYLLVGLAGALACLLDRPFRYPWLGVRLERYLEGDTQQGEDRWMAAMGHLGVMIAAVGLVIPLVVSGVRRRESPLASFHGLQAAVYQAIGFAAQMLYFAAGSLLLLPLPILLSFFNSGDLAANSLGMLLSILTVLILLLVFLGVPMLVYPLYSTLPLIAAYRLLKGRDYRYPLVAGWTERWLMRRPLSTGQTG